MRHFWTNSPSLQGPEVKMAFERLAVTHANLAKNGISDFSSFHSKTTREQHISHSMSQCRISAISLHVFSLSSTRCISARAPKKARLASKVRRRTDEYLPKKWLKKSEGERERENRNTKEIRRENTKWSDHVSRLLTPLLLA